ncbi:PMS1 protein homolog 1-like [Sycon ciliatum]|uniref:PMS1 protein homolog 1-like n=1 Tax=Sycon ciliatum TaxID=27933 RepID=UPI0031F669E3
MNALPPSTVQRIASGQVITSVSAAVKELVENSLDAGASNITVRLENYGLDVIEVRDNGSGISPSQACHVALAHYTSKLSSHDDLMHVRSYGFRGEALSSLCCVATVKITSRTADDDVASQYSLDKQGHIVTTKPSAGDVGTTITAQNIFANLPVRRQVFKTARRCKEELREVEDRLLGLALAVPGVRMQLVNNKQTVWQRPSGGDFTAAAVAVFGTSTFSQLKMHYGTGKDIQASAEASIHISALLPKPLASTASVLRSTSNRSFIIMNNRPVDYQALHKKLKSTITPALLAGAMASVSGAAVAGSSRSHPAYCLMITLPTTRVDVNVNPAKNIVLIDQEELLLEAVDELLQEAYPAASMPAQTGAATTQDAEEPTMKSTARKTESRSTNAPAMNQASVADVPTEDDDFVGNAAADLDLLSKSQWVDLVDDDLVLDDESADVPGAASTTTDTSAGAGGTQAIPDSPGFPDLPTPPSSFIHASALFTQSAGEQHRVTVDSDATMPSGDNGHSEVQAVPKSPRTIAEGTDGLAEVGSDGWSRGHELATEDGNTVEPVMFLAPRTVATSSSSTGAAVTNRSTAAQVSSSRCNMSASSAQLSSNSHGGEDSGHDKPSAPGVGRAGDIGAPADSVTREYTHRPIVVDFPETAVLATALAQRKPAATPLAARADAPPLVSPVLFDVPARTASSSPAIGLPNFSLDASQLSQTPSQQPMEATAPPTVSLSANVGAAEKRSALLPSTPAAKRSKPATATPSSLKRQPMRQVKLPYSIKPLTNESFSYAVGGPVVDVPVSFHTVRERFLAADAGPERDDFSGSNGSDAIAIGPLHPSAMWCVLQQSSLSLLNHFRAKELLLYQQLCSTHTLLSKPLEKPIAVNCELLNDQRLWDRLVSMQQVRVDTSGACEFDDPLLVKNGFRLVQDSNGDSIRLVAVSTDIPCYGYPDLVELLRVIVEREANGQSVTVATCRPRKVLTYLESEVVRLCRKLPDSLSRTAVAEILADISLQPETECRCFHGRPILQLLANVDELDLS